MEGKSDKAKGHIKEAVGDLTDNDDLKREGEADKASGTVKEHIENVAEKAKDLADKMRDKFLKGDDDK